MDAALRLLERRWRTAPLEPERSEALIQALTRAGRPTSSTLLACHPRWSRLASFVGRWCRRPVRDGDGVAPGRIAAAERRLGVRLPRALRELYLLLGRRRDALPRTFLVPAAPEGLRVRDGLLVLAEEVAGVYALGLRVEDLGVDDPPVVRWDDAGLPLRRVSDELSTFWLQLCLFLRTTALDAPADPAGTRTAVERSYTPLPLAPWPSDLTGQLRFFGNAETVLWLESQGWVGLAVRSTGALARARQALGPHLAPDDPLLDPGLRWC